MSLVPMWEQGIANKPVYSGAPWLIPWYLDENLES